MPFDKAGDDTTGSPIEFEWSTVCSGPALITKESPSSLVIRIFPSYATGEPANVAGTGGRLPSYLTSPVLESMQVSRPLSVIK